MHKKLVIHKSNRRTISLSVKDDGIVFIKAPRYVSDTIILKFTEEKHNWIEKRIKEAKIKTEKTERFKSLVDKNQIKNYKEKTRMILTERVGYYADRFNLSHGDIRMSSAKSRWGSCSAKNGLNFNWKIFFAPPEVQDYLVAHELAHTVHRNHKKQFWNLVEKMHPDFKNSRRWLKENSHLLSVG